MRMFTKLFVVVLALAAVGCCKNDGADFAKDIPADERPAMQEIFDKASSGDTNAQAYLGVLFYTGTIGRNHNAAYTWFKKASDNGSGEADYFISEMYENGIHLNQNSEEAFKYLRSSAEKGFTSARFKLAEMFLNGEKTEVLNKEELLGWVKAYADQDNAKAKELLAKLDSDSVKKDTSKSAKKKTSKK
ncbi:MAG: tetratricopeptide repeat protein [Elusimicrobiaceae bacterium]